MSSASARTMASARTIDSADSIDSAADKSSEDKSSEPAIAGALDPSPLASSPLDPPRPDYAAIRGALAWELSGIVRRQARLNARAKSSKISP